MIKKGATDITILYESNFCSSWTTSFYFKGVRVKIFQVALHVFPTCSVFVFVMMLTHWGRVTLICVGNLTIIGPDNGLSPGRRQAIIWINAGILLIGPGGTNFNEIFVGIRTFSFKKIHFKMSSAKWRPLCLGLNVLKCDALLNKCFINFIAMTRAWQTMTRFSQNSHGQTQEKIFS